MVVDLKNLVMKAVAFEQAHKRKIYAGLVFVLTHPAQVHNTALAVWQQVVALFAGVQ